eukprot:TRINITY_DN879_c0_g1_i1.p2 TRINITY_DN879_c0_g1~~TRINITY_DN879_c0_g1_i1.p2  ORF type:complete len:516 (+),score=67.49 TRINITY_DN879_c0_g1_i1:4189-5736(+)
MEVDVVIQCRKSDAELVKELIEETGTEYVTRLKNEVPKLKGRDIKYRLVVDEKSYLPEHNTRESGLPSCLGGVQLRAQRDRIVCNNTLDARLELCYQDALPEIRSILFPNQFPYIPKRIIAYIVLRSSQHILLYMLLLFNNYQIQIKSKRTMTQPQDLFSIPYERRNKNLIEFKLAGEEKLNFREISNANIGSILMGNVSTLQKLIPHICNVNLMHDKGYPLVQGKIELAGASEEGMKALQIMQLALQYLSYSQQVLVQKIQTTKLYTEEQKRQIQACQTVHKKQKTKIKNYEQAIEGLNEQALHYELLAKKLGIFNKKEGLLKELMEGDEMLLNKATKGETLYQALETHQRKIAEAKKVLATKAKENVSENIEKNEEEDYLEMPFEESKEEVKELPEEKKVDAKKEMTVSHAGELNVIPKKEEQKEIIESSSNDDALISGMSLSYTASQVNFPASSGRVNYLLTAGSNPENVISQRALLENQTRLTNYRSAVPEEKSEDEDIAEDIGGDKDQSF